MNFITKSLCSVALLGFTVAPLISLTGCAQNELITYAKDARRDGLALYKEANYTEAAASFRNATRQDPTDYNSFFDLGCCYDQLKQYQLAILSYRNSLHAMTVTARGQENRKFRMEVLDALAWSTSQAVSHQAETDALEASARSTTNAEDFFLLAKLHRYSGDVDASIDAYNRCTLLAPQEFAYVKEYGLYLQKLSQNEKAAVALRRAYQIRDDDRDVNVALAQLGVSVGKVTGSDATATISNGPASGWEFNREGTRPMPGRLSSQPRGLSASDGRVLP